MWWREVAQLADLTVEPMRADERALADIHPTAILDESGGPIRIGAGTRICPGAFVAGPVTIGRDCLIGNNSMVRGPSVIGDRVRIGFAAEVKQALIGDEVAIGPQCFVADSKLEPGVYLGAQVRTSNQRLDRHSVRVMADGSALDTGMDKLGCRIGARAAIGIQCIVLPGREVPGDSIFEPRITIARNFQPGHYRAESAIAIVPQSQGEVG